jgi:hypothetical protein
MGNARQTVNWSPYCHPHFARPIYHRYDAYVIHEGTVISKYLEQLNETTGTVVHRRVANGSEYPFRNTSLLLCYMYFILS